MSDIELTGRTSRMGEDASLVSRAAGGDRDAYAELIASRVDRLLRTARAILGNEAEAHDAAQDAFVSAWVTCHQAESNELLDAIAAARNDLAAAEAHLRASQRIYGAKQSRVALERVDRALLDLRGRRA